jgi:uncharacterized protein (DUF2141 family)
MFRIALRFVLLDAVVCTLICGLPVLAQQPTGTALISGRVVVAATGTPLKSAQVVLAKEHPTEQDVKAGEYRGYHATTDIEGRFTLKDVKPGTYRLAVHKNGYVDQSYKAPGSVAASPLTLTAGKDLPDVLFRLVAAGVITGRVVNEDGEPVVGVQMQALVRAASLPRRVADFRSLKLETAPVTVAVTNDLGEYRLHGLAPGDYLVSASDTGIGDMAEVLLAGHGGISFEAGYESQSPYAPMYFPGTADLGQAQPITLKGGDEARANFVLRPVKMVSVSGRVLNGRRPVQGAFVSLSSDSADIFSTMTHQAQTEPDGRFTITNVPPGHYTASATIVNSDEGQRQLTGGQANIDVGDTDVTGIDLLLVRGVKLSGRVVSENPGAVKLSDIYLAFTSISRDQDSLATAEVNKEGVFTTSTDLPPGTYRVQVGGLPDGWYLRSVRAGTQEVINSGLTVTRGAQPPLELVIALGAAQITGKVLFGDKPVGGATVWIASESSQVSEPTTASADQNGDFVVKNLRPGKYRLVAFIEADSPWSFTDSQLTDESSSDATSNEVVTVRAGEKQSIVLRMASVLRDQVR